MIHSIRCDKPSFQTVVFNPGFNVVVAERTKEATRKDSRNGLGKSTSIEIIHFCLGGNKGETLKKPQLNDWTFTIDIDLGEKRYSVTRNTKNTNKIIIEGDCTEWVIKPTIDKKTGKQIISRNDWTKQLGILMFDLQPMYDEYKYAPTFRSMISYFVRKNHQSGGFLNPFQQYKAQLEWDQQVNNSFLLGLGWEYASKWQVLKDRVKVLAQIKQEATTGLISHMMGNIGELESLKIRLGAQVKQEKEHLDNFKVHPQYGQIEQDANRLTKAIHERVNLNIDEKRLLEHYESSLNEEIDATPDRVTKIYEEAGLILPDNITKKMNDVITFHKKVVVNRRDFLNSEMEKIKQNVVQRETEIKELSARRVELMLTLKSHGALQEYTQLQNNHQNTVAQLKDVSQRLDNLKKFEQGRSSINVEHELLLQQAKNDLNERSSQKEEAVLAFNSYSKTMYSAPGILSINISKTGFKFDVKIERSGSQGIGNMKIFCYDLMLAKLWVKKAKSPIFLIHDSIIFDGVDERQKALALQLADS
ncbi:MAG: DUF2326 domain-containing protein, partial [Candidatus Thermoplasmatota archaeon]|nr:DUF2326 domain-containing protein [Candidatus Thermoplasmatota archaeon]